MIQHCATRAQIAGWPCNNRDLHPWKSRTQEKRTGLVTLAIEWEDPALAAKWANALVRHVNARLRAEAVDEADRSIAYLEKQLPQTSSVEVQQAIYRLIEAQTKKKMVASTREQFAFRVIDPAVRPEEIAMDCGRLTGEPELIA